MHLTDAEIREILIREKREKRRRQRMRRRIALLVIVVLVIVLAVVIAVKSHDSKEETPAEKTVRGIIFLDPGHGGEDPGSESDGRYEKDDTLALALAVRDELRALDFKVEMSRDSDITVERSDRGKMAVAAGAQLMLSIHRNKAQGEGNGAEIYIPMADTDESRLLGENLMKTLVKLGFSERSITAGMYLDPTGDYEELAAAGSIPACLAEVGFINDDGDNRIFDENMDANAKAIAASLSDTFAALYEDTDAADSESGDAGQD